MPFTPFHFGPGFFIKGLIPNQFSLSVFALANVAMDVEPLYRMWHGDAYLHGISHTMFGAACIGVATALAGRTVVARAGRLYGGRYAPGGEPWQITRLQAWMGALFGTGSHLLLDAVMHADMHPLLPLTEYNPLLRVSWTENVYLGCVLAGMLGLLLLFVRSAVVREHA